MSTSNQMRVRLAVASILAVAANTPAHAQMADSGAGMTMAIEEIVVTAEKREAKLQDVPVAISAYTDATRDLMGIRSIEDFASFTPGLNFASNDRLSIRGVGRLTNALGSDPGVATYNDGLYTSSTTESNKSSLFVDRVEFLRGPQGTLYGRNSMGGAINIISKRPSRDSYQSEVRAIAGNYETKNVEASFSGPITDSFAFRLAGSSSNRDKGYFENDAGEDRYRQQRTAVEVQIEADLGDRTKLWMKYANNRWGTDNSDGNLNSVLIDKYFSGSVFPTGSLVPNGQYLATLAGLSNPAVSDPYHISEDTDASLELNNNQSVVSHLTFDFDKAQLKWIAGWQEAKFTITNDFDLTSLKGPVTSFRASTAANAPTVQFLTPVFPSYVSEFIDSKRVYSNEINLTSSGDGPHKWIVGLYQYHEEEVNPVSLYAPGNAAQINAPFMRLTATGLAPSTVLAAPNANGRFYYANGELDSDSYAAFGQFDYALNEQWTVTVGARYSKDEKDGDENTRLIAFFPTATGTGTGAVDVSPALSARHLTDSWNDVSGKVGVEWKPSSDVMTYANYNRGYKSGGFNLGTIIGGADPSAATVDKETLDAFEVGFKTNLMPNLQVNGAVFYYLYDNAQIPFAQFRNGINITTFENTDVTSYGAEVETLWAATENLSFLFNYSYLRAEDTRSCQYVSPTNFKDCFYDNSDPQALKAGAQPVGLDAAGNTLQNLDGNQVPQAPENKIAFNTSYRFNFAPGSLTLSGTYAWQDETTYSLFANPDFRVPDYGTADFRILWNDAQDRYTLIGFIDNAFDEEGSLSAAVTALSQGAVRSRGFIAPATYGLEVQVRF